MWRKATAAGAAVLVMGLAGATAGAHDWPRGWSHGWPHGLALGWSQFPRWTRAERVGGINEADSAEGCPFESPDGLSLFFASNRGQEPNDIWVADRTSIDAPWQAPRRLESPINIAGFGDFCPTPVRGRSLMFVSTRGGAGSCGDGDMYISRQSPAGGWSEPVNLGCEDAGGPNTPGGERSPSLVETSYGTFLFYSTNGTTNHQDIRVSQMRKDGTFGRGKIIHALSTPSQDLMPNVRERDSGGFEIVFSSDRPVSLPNGQVQVSQDVYMSFAWFLPGPWSPPRNVGDGVNTPGSETRATLSRDGERLYFGRDGDIFVSKRR